MPEKTQKIRTRLAPSPTGMLHMGTARTALFSWLFAHKFGGTFVLRIEDTDTKRSNKEFERDIIENLLWLGLDWDEGPLLKGEKGHFGPYRQSARSEKYSPYIKELLDKKRAYHCFCTKEELETQRKKMFARKEAPRYAGTCRALEEGDAKGRIARGDDYVIRFKTISGEIKFDDIIRGGVVFEGDLIGDFVIAKDEHTPLYNFAVVVDDHEMEITHVIRGEDHISNTPRQILLQEALGFERAIYAHLPLILAPDKSKMSKRRGLFSVSEYKDLGYFSDVIVNFLALLGWHLEGDREIFDRQSLIENFSLERVQKSGAIFDIAKLDWLNSEYIKKLDAAALLGALRPYVEKRGWEASDEFLSRVIAVERGRIKKLSDFCEFADFFFERLEYPTELLHWKNNAPDITGENLKRTLDVLEHTEESDLSEGALEVALNELAQERGKGDVYWPLRVALSAKRASPGPLEIMAVLKKDEVLARVRIAIDKLQ